LVDSIQLDSSSTHTSRRIATYGFDIDRPVQWEVEVEGVGRSS
jgi:hypothetical protein